MRLHALRVRGFRRIREADFFFGDATFLIGANNSGKSTVLRAIEALLAARKRLSDTDYYAEVDEDGETKPAVEEVVLEAEFRNLPALARGWRGFKGRLHTYDVDPDVDESGLAIRYRKRFPLGADVVVELLSKGRSVRAEFADCKSGDELIAAGLPEEALKDAFGGQIPSSIRNKGAREALDLVDEYWEVDDQVEDWFQNPGGIPGNVLSRLPRILVIPADTSRGEIDDRTGALTKTLNELFQIVRDRSPNYQMAQKSLKALQEELDPSDSGSEFGQMMGELNKVLSSVFPEAALHALADLTDPDTVLRPSFNVNMSSNVRTPIEQQGTGMVRSAVFALLRFRHQWLDKQDPSGEQRSLIIAFEEPEIYLHPSAANNMRDTIYELSTGSSQIVATTHSPFLIDLSRKPRQVLNRLSRTPSGAVATPFSVTEKFLELSADDRSYVKMLLSLDDHVARVFFSETAVIVEGDTEELALRHTLARLPEAERRRIYSTFEIIRARGKAAIIGLVKYLNALGVKLAVIHDRDADTPNAAKFNAPIADAVGDPSRVVVLNECIEDALGYPPPSGEKPYRAFQEAQKWGEGWPGVPSAWRSVVEQLFGIEPASGVEVAPSKMAVLIDA